MAREIALRSFVLVASWAIGLVLAAGVVPGVVVSASGFAVAAVVFALSQAIASLSLLAVPRWYVPLLLGATGLVLTVVALLLASTLTRGISIDGTASWMATTTVVWLVTTIGAITLPELLLGDGGSGSGRHT